MHTHMLGRRELFARVCAAISTLGFAVGSRAALIVGSDATQTGGVLTVSPASELVVSGFPTPTLTLTSGATTSGVQGVVVGTAQFPYGYAGNLLVEGGSTLTNAGVGAEGTYDFFQISAGNGYLGLNAGAAGNLTVTDAGSTFTNTGTLYVGVLGSGAMSVLSGGVVSASSGVIGQYGGSSGSVSVSGTGSTWTTTGDLTVGNLGGGMLDIDSNGLVQVSGATTVGNTQSSITLASGATLKTGRLNLGGNSSLLHWSGGTLQINAYNETIGSGFDLGTSLTVGTGQTLQVIDGAGGSTHGVLSVASSGAFNVTGGDVLVRSLNIDSGGSILGRGNLNFTNGSIEVSGGSLSFTNGGTLYVTGAAGTNPLFKLTNGATSSNIGSVYVGVGPLDATTFNLDTSSPGRLSIESGAVLNSADSLAATSNITITGAGSSWAPTSLFLGVAGNATLNVNSGGSLVCAGTVAFGDNGAFSLGSSKGFGSGTATISGTGSAFNAQAVTFYNGTLNLQSGATSSVQSLSFTNGAIDIESGAGLTSTGADVDSPAGSSSFVKVAGIGSSWSTGSLIVGDAGSGSFTASTGATVQTIIPGGQSNVNPGAIIGNQAGSTGKVTLSGTGTSWTVQQPIYLGNSGNGTLTIEAGAQLKESGGAVLLGMSTSGTTLAVQTGSSASATVTGSGSLWSVAGAISIGEKGNGAVMVENGGSVSCAVADIGIGSATVTGIGSNWTCSQNFDFAGPTATLSIGNGGSMSVGGSVLFVTAAVGAKINLSSGGTLTANSIYLAGAPAGLNWTGGTLNLTGGKTPIPGSTTTTDTGLSIPHGGILMGTGTIGGSVTNAGTFSPGDAPGLINIDGSLSGAGNYDMEIASLSAFDQIDATGAISFAGSQIDVVLLGFSPALGDTFDLFQSPGTMSGSWTFNFSRASLAPGLQWNTSDFAQTGEISVGAAVPEPGMLTPVLIGALAFSRRRKRLHVA